jgi:hypothetical protein
MKLMKVKVATKEMVVPLYKVPLVRVRNKVAITDV